MKVQKFVFVLIASLSVPAVAVAGPDTAGGETKKADGKLTEADVAVLQHHHAVNLMEIEMGKLAKGRGSPSVKAYAVALIKDHQKADKDALALAKARGAKLMDHAMPANAAEEADHKKAMETMERLKTLEGATFDREYLTAMIDGHTAEVGYITSAVTSVTDAKLKAHLEKVKPVVEKHADQARGILGAATPAPTPATPSK